MGAVGHYVDVVGVRSRLNYENRRDGIVERGPEGAARRARKDACVPPPDSTGAAKDGAQFLLLIYGVFVNR
jgi:hypothetical protein